MMLSGLSALVRYWLPPHVDRALIAPKLARFYAERADYHKMTAREDKVDHPQVRLLLGRIRPTDTVVEFGCGGGVVLSAAGQLAKEAIGFDIGEIALAKANSRPGRHHALKSDVANVPLRDNFADLAYSFEVLEHVWNPADVIREMIRVVKPGGTVFFTTPNDYNMHLHLSLRRSVRIIHHLGAVVSSTLASLRKVPYENLPPDLDADPVYPDCDRISRTHPKSLARFLRNSGCDVERLETFFFLREKSNSETERQRYERLERHPFYHWYGDHILFVGTKRATL
jgi:SAM-dependent methyltransferase